MFHYICSYENHWHHPLRKKAVRLAHSAHTISCIELMQKIPGTKVVGQTSPHRCYSDDDYRNCGIEVTVQKDFINPDNWNTTDIKYNLIFLAGISYYFLSSK